MVFWESWNRNLLPVSRGTGQEQHGEQQFFNSHGVILLGGIDFSGKHGRCIHLDAEWFDFPPVARRNTPNLDLACCGTYSAGQEVKAMNSQFSSLQVFKCYPRWSHLLHPDGDLFSTSQDRKYLSQPEQTGTNEKFLLPGIDHGDLDTLDEFDKGRLADFGDGVVDHRHPAGVLVKSKGSTLTGGDRETLAQRQNALIKSF